MPIKVNALDHLVVNVTDAEKSAVWYERALGMVRQDFDPGGGYAKRIAMIFGDQKINLRPREATQQAWFSSTCAF